MLGVVPSPKRKPAALKLVEGRAPGRDSGGRPVVEGPAFVRTPPSPPYWLDGEALAEWHRVVPELARLDLLKAIDSASLTAYCLAWARLADAQATVAAEGYLTRNRFGERVRHPALITVELASKELRAWAGEFALTPSAEARVAGRVEHGSEADSSAFG